MLHMLALENGGEHHQGLQLARAVIDHHGQLPAWVGPVLIRGRHHAAAIVPSEHGRSQPDLLEFMPDPVHGNDGIGGLIVEQQALDGDGGIVDGLVALFSLLIAHLAAVAVDAVADAVQESVALALHLHGGQAQQIFFQREGFAALGLAQVREEIVAAAGGVIINFIRDVQALRVVDEPIQGAVSAGKDDPGLRIQTCKQLGIVVNFGHILVFQAVAQEHFAQVAGLPSGCAVASMGIKEDQVGHGQLPFLSILRMKIPVCRQPGRISTSFYKNLPVLSSRAGRFHSFYHFLEIMLRFSDTGR